MPKSRRPAILQSRCYRDYRHRQKRDWYDYVMLALAFAVLLVSALGLLR